ncbi:hypothetical protein [Halomonas kalidii]|uniref:HPr kinase n=1 Tax=Halomonas kalidii TaxID=3043293 RepID=A0ABT6VM64_9GAMM|nr:hypothetical protein [Halomonas kalidii]MDI5934352.1 hypothetical protein [Halomonas kalidii]
MDESLQCVRIDVGVGSVEAKVPASLAQRLEADFWPGGEKEDRIAVIAWSPEQPSEVAEHDAARVKNFAFYIEEADDVLRCRVWLDERSWRRQVSRRLPETVLKWMTPRYAGMDEMRYLDFLYHVLLPVLQLALVRQNCSLLHTAAMDVGDGRIVLLAGSGGAGKTSTLSACVRNSPSWRLLADDFTVLSANGQAFGLPMACHVYPYNINYVSGSAPVADAGFFDTAHWLIRNRLFGAKGVVRRLPLSALGEIVSGGRISALIWIEPGQEMSLEAIKDSQELLSNIEEMMSHELHTLWSLIDRGCGTLDRGDIMVTMLSVIKQAVGRVPVMHATFSPNCSTDERVSVVRRVVAALE